MTSMPNMHISAPEDKENLVRRTKAEPLKLHVIARVCITHIACLNCANAECAVTR